MTEEAPPISRRTAWKIVVSVLVGVVAVGSLFYASMSEDMQLYRMVDEVMAAPGQYLGKRVQVHGYVVDGSIEQRKGTLEYRFKMQTRPPRAPAVIEASYKGLVPDTFKSGAEVVATGMLTPGHQLEASSISAKCPSKYEAKPGMEKPIGQGAAQL